MLTLTHLSSGRERVGIVLASHHADVGRLPQMGTMGGRDDPSGAEEGCPAVLVPPAGLADVRQKDLPGPLFRTGGNPSYDAILVGIAIYI